jgi:Icc-related predicted phosphoesterase
VRIRVLSDLHDDIRHNAVGALPHVDCDVVVVAGDAQAPGTEALRLIRNLFPDRDLPLVYVPGNHDFYSEGDPKKLRTHPHLHTTWEAQHAQMPEVAADLGIVLMNDSTAVINGVRFVGGTLWTDFSARPGFMSLNDAMREAVKMNDYRLIKVKQGRSKDVLRPRDTLEAHRRSRVYLESELTTPFDGDTVLVTHHAASCRSLRGYNHERPEVFRNLDHCYATNQDCWFTGEGMGEGYVPPVLAIHGHIHEFRDLVVGGTRIVANPRGYPVYDAPNSPRENPDFDPEFGVEIGREFAPAMRI